MSDKLTQPSEASGIEVQISESLRHTGPVPYFGPGRGNLGSLVHSVTQCDTLMMKVNLNGRQQCDQPFANWLPNCIRMWQARCSMMLWCKGFQGFSMLDFSAHLHAGFCVLSVPLPGQELEIQQLFERSYGLPRHV